MMKISEHLLHVIERPVNVVLFDYDGVLAEPGCDVIDEAILDAIKTIAEFGVKICIVTSNYRIVNFRIESFWQLAELSEDVKHEIYIYHVGVTRLGVFSNGRYRHLSFVARELPNLDIVARVMAWHGAEIKYIDPFCVVARAIKFRDEIVENAYETLELYGLGRINLWKCGRTHIYAITTKMPKYHVVSKFISDLGVSPSSVIYFGDEFVPGGSDMEVVMTGVVCVSIGQNSSLPSLRSRKEISDFIYQLINEHIIQ